MPQPNSYNFVLRKGAGQLDTSRFEQFSALMTSAAKSVAKLKAAQMDAFSLSGAHTNCLCRLYEAGSLTQGELTRAVQMDRSQVSRVLRDLAQKGYVSADAQAGYKRRYALTPTGQETAARVEAIILDINRFVSGSISDADIEIFYKTLTTITRNLQSAVETYAKGVSHE